MNDSNATANRFLSVERRRIRRKMAVRGTTVTALAVATGIHRPRLSGLLAGAEHARPEVLDRIRKAVFGTIPRADDTVPSAAPAEGGVGNLS